MRDLLAARHTVEVEAFLIDHRFRDVVFLFPFFEEAAIVEDSLLDEGVDVLGREAFRREGLLILEVSSAFFVREIIPGFLILIPSIGHHRFFLAFGELTSGGLFFYETCR